MSDMDNSANEWRVEFKNNQTILGVRGADLVFMQNWLTTYTQKILNQHTAQIVKKLERLDRKILQDGETGEETTFINRDQAIDIIKDNK